MGIRDRLRRIRDEWRAAPVPNWPKPKPETDHGVCSQRGCIDPAIGPNKLCGKHAATI